MEILPTNRSCIQISLVPQEHLELMPPWSEMSPVAWALKFCKNGKRVNSLENASGKTSYCAKQVNPGSGLLMN